MLDGVDSIYSPTLFDGEFLGYPDFLIKARDDDGNPITDEQGRFVYDPVDAKSAKSEKRAAVLQVAAYAYAMVKLGFPRPNKVHLWLASDKRWSTAAADLLDLGEFFYKRALNRVLSFLSYLRLIGQLHEKLVLAVVGMNTASLADEALMIFLLFKECVPIPG